MQIHTNNNTRSHYGPWIFPRGSPRGYSQDAPSLFFFGFWIFPMQVYSQSTHLPIGLVWSYTSLLPGEQLWLGLWRTRFGTLGLVGLEEPFKLSYTTIYILLQPSPKTGPVTCPPGLASMPRCPANKHSHTIGVEAFGQLVEGYPPDRCYLPSRGDPGLLVRL